ncbi:hypothetical protein BJY01DRAFT_200147 [Aspergillus pseudoustus]|uniref:Uncharacterized protein n=1 Tax=Aspergillus pseudoustus TaxID=1810923 RepID=A0ABR4JSJ9_9EURO
MGRRSCRNSGANCNWGISWLPERYHREYLRTLDSQFLCGQVQFLSLSTPSKWAEVESPVECCCSPLAGTVEKAQRRGEGERHTSWKEWKEGKMEAKQRSSGGAGEEKLRSRTQTHQARELDSWEQAIEEKKRSQGSIVHSAREAETKNYSMRGAHGLISGLESRQSESDELHQTSFYDCLIDNVISALFVAALLLLVLQSISRGTLVNSQPPLLRSAPEPEMNHYDPWLQQHQT